MPTRPLMFAVSALPGTVLGFQLLVLFQSVFGDANPVQVILFPNALLFRANIENIIWRFFFIKPKSNLSEVKPLAHFKPSFQNPIFFAAIYGYVENRTT